MKARKFSLGSFPVNGCDPFGSMCLFLRVSPAGELRLEGMIRVPFSDRPIRGGGKGVPRSWLDVRACLDAFPTLNTFPTFYNEQNVTAAM
jgi:hypothetical protein